MGRSFLSVKLALAFGLCVSVLVLVADGVQAGPADAVPAVVEQPAPRVQEVASEAEVCLWRGCPLTVGPRHTLDARSNRNAAAGRLTDTARRIDRSI